MAKCLNVSFCSPIVSKQGSCLIPYVAMEKVAKKGKPLLFSRPRQATFLTILCTNDLESALLLLFVRGNSRPDQTGLDPSSELEPVVGAQLNYLQGLRTGPSRINLWASLPVSKLWVTCFSTVAFKNMTVTR